MYLTQAQVDGSREVRINIYQTDDKVLVEIRTYKTAYVYRVHPLLDTPLPEMLHTLWLHLSDILPYTSDSDADLEQYMFNSLVVMGGSNAVYRLERLSERPTVAPLPEKKLPAKRKRR